MTETIVLVCDFPPGLASRVLDVYRFFRQHPHIIFVTRRVHITTDRQISMSLFSIPLPVKGLVSGGVTNRLAGVLSVTGYLFNSLVLCLRICRVNHSVRLVHAHYIFPEGLFGLILARFLRVALVISAVGQDVNDDLRNPFLRGICRFVLMHADLTMAVSRPLQRALLEFGVSNCIYLPNSVDTQTLRPCEKTLRSKSVLFVGTMNPRKRPLTLVKAFERVVAAVPDATLSMVGKGPLLELVRTEIQRRGLDSKVVIYPQVTTAFLEALLSEAAVFVLPSTTEGLSVALLEAMASGKVIVASDNESHRDALRDGSEALLFQLDNEKDLAEKIISALTDTQLRMKLSDAARSLCVKEFSNLEVARKLEALYLQLLETPPEATQLKPR